MCPMCLRFWDYPLILNIIYFPFFLSFLKINIIKYTIEKHTNGTACLCSSIRYQISTALISADRERQRKFWLCMTVYIKLCSNGMLSKCSSRLNFEQKVIKDKTNIKLNYKIDAFHEQLTIICRCVQPQPRSQRTRYISTQCAVMMWMIFFIRITNGLSYQ